MSLTVRGFNCVTFFRLDPSSALDFLWACSHIPRIWQGRDQKISQVRSKAHVQSPESKSPFFSAFFMKAQPDRVHSAEADDSFTFFFSFSFLSVQKKTEKFVLRLTSEELISLVDLILSESELNSRDSPHDDKSSSLDQVSCSLIQSRLPLLHSYCNGDLENIKKVSEYLINCTKKWEDR